jgi:hypothetical protein
MFSCFVVLKVVFKIRNEVSPAPGSGVAVEIRLFSTPLESLKEEIKDFARLSVTKMLDMDTTNLRPGTVRNDFYLTLERGDVQQVKTTNNKIFCNF